MPEEKAPALSRQGFFFVDKRIEISNSDLIIDLASTISMEEISSKIK